ncbi:MAG: galactose mutarotase [Betaproteobacteria bacterium]|nr:galactose mutarotase [Betaproteobacteria bacterium]
MGRATRAGQFAGAVQPGTDHLRRRAALTPLDPARFEGTVNGRAVGLFVLRSSALQAAWCNHGARLLQLAVPDRDGKRRDVVLGHDSLPQLLQGMPSMGAFVGRFANRIAHSRFTVDGQVHRLPANDGPHCLHGGPGGSRHQVFNVLEHSAERLLMGWTFRSEDDGFPGEVDLRVGYRLEAAALVVDYSAKVRGAATPLNFTSHGFFNLDGDEARDVYGHHLQIDADRFVPVDAQRIPLGVMAAVGGSAFDFRTSRTLRDALAQAMACGDAQIRLGALPGFDHAFVTGSTDGWQHNPQADSDAADAPLQRQARLYSSVSGIAMEVWSDAPSVQLYSGAALDGSLPRHAGKHSRVYGPGAGVCLEPQGLPDAPNQPGFGRWACRPGQTLRGRIEYRFSTDRST